MPIHAGLHPSQHIESENQPKRNPSRFNRVDFDSNEFNPSGTGFSGVIPAGIGFSVLGSVGITTAYKVARSADYNPNMSDPSTYRLFETGGSGPDIGRLVSFQFEAADVPEPTTWAMLLAGLGAVGLTLRRRPLAAVAR